MTDFEIVSFEGALPLRFGMTPGEVARIIGQPRLAPHKRQGVLCYDYYEPTLNLSIGFGGDLQSADHFGFGPGSTVRFRSLDFFADHSSWRRLLGWSSDYHECLGFLVFCDLGITLTGFQDDYEDELSVTAFPQGKWEEFRPEFKPFLL